MNTDFTAYFEPILDTFPDGIWLSDADSTCLFVNKKYEELSGFSREWMMGRKATSIIEEGVFDVIVNPDVIATGKPISKVQKLSNGRHLSLEGFPITDESGHVAMCITFIRDISTIINMECKLAQQRGLLDKLIYIQNKTDLNSEEDGISFTDSPSMSSFLQLVNILAQTDFPILILGETGTGKDVTAHRIHAFSSRASKPFIKAECVNMNPTRMASEIFGDTTTDYVGKSNHISLIEAAEGGTLFLEEIGALSLDLQERILRFLDDGLLRSEGSSSPRKMNVRIIASTNKILDRSVARGEFSNELYQRLKIAVLNIPPLRMRRDDIIPLAKYFLHHFSQRYNRSVELADDACEALLAYAWPGNVRELKGIMQRSAMMTTEALIHAEDLLLEQASTPSSVYSMEDFIDHISFEGRDYRDIMLELEAQMLKAAIRKSAGNMAAASRMLKMDRSTMFRKIKNMEQHGFPV